MSTPKQNAVIRSWLDHARSDFELACVKKTPKIHYEHLCFHAQQAAEKSIKALLLSLHIEVPRTHDLAYIIDLLPKTFVRPPLLLVLPVLTKYAVQFRYPGQEITVTRKEYLKAVALARSTLDWANDLIK
jgi:HEPN domain-containing protein